MVFAIVGVEVTVGAGVLDIRRGELAPAGELVAALDSPKPNDWMGEDNPNWLVGLLPGLLLVIVDVLDELVLIGLLVGTFGVLEEPDEAEAVDVDCDSGSGGGGGPELTVLQ